MCAVHVREESTRSLLWLFLIRASNTLQQNTEVKSVYEPSGPLSRRLSGFQQHEVTWNISTPSWMGC